jgi:hypothetical protein
MTSGSLSTGISIVRTFERSNSGTRPINQNSSNRLNRLRSLLTCYNLAFPVSFLGAKRKPQTNAPKRPRNKLIELSVSFETIELNSYFCSDSFRFPVEHVKHASLRRAGKTLMLGNLCLFKEPAFVASLFEIWF